MGATSNAPSSEAKVNIMSSGSLMDEGLLKMEGLSRVNDSNSSEGSSSMALNALGPGCTGMNLGRDLLASSILLSDGTNSKDVSPSL